MYRRVEPFLLRVLCWEQDVQLECSVLFSGRMNSYLRVTDGFGTVLGQAQRDSPEVCCSLAVLGSAPV
jgi:hypothetical protein